MRLPHLFGLLVTVATCGSTAAEPLTFYETVGSRGFSPYVARFTPNSRYVLMAGERMTNSGQQPELRVWDVEAREIVGEHRLNRVGAFVSLDIAPDGRTLAMGTADNKPKGTHESSLWDWTMQPSRGPRLRSSLDHVRQLTVGVHDFCVNPCFSADGSLVAVTRTDGPDPRTGMGFSRIEWMRSSGELLHSFVSPPRVVCGKAFSPDGGTLATSIVREVAINNGDAQRQIEIVLWDVETGKEEQQATLTTSGTPTYHYYSARLAYSPDGKFIASDGPDWTVQLWNADTLEPLRKLEGLRSELTAVQFSPDGGMVVGASGTFEGRICIWSRESGKVLWKYDQVETEWHVASFSPDGNWLVTKSLQLDARRKKSIVQIQLWDVHYLLGVGGDEAGELQ